jgi:hypothetical protein
VGDGFERRKVRELLELDGFQEGCGRGLYLYTREREYLAPLLSTGRQPLILFVTGAIMTELCR